jgi:hypothetical protein
MITLNSPLSKMLKFSEQKRCTLLGVGPMSRNCVDTAVKLANKFEIPIMLIASRRQIDSASFGGGYVNNWTTETFAQYVREIDQKSMVVLARDHGGPWQHPSELTSKMNLAEAMESCKRSYEADIDAGFSIIHIDPSVDPYDTPSVDQILDRIFELYLHCWRYAQQTGKTIAFEIGTEEQSGGTNSPQDLEYVLEHIQRFCSENALPMPLFVVIQSGTRVMETRNVGTFESPVRIINELPAEILVPMMIEICGKYGVKMKEHNTDYLSNEALRWHPRLGIHAANVAPEFGVAETRALFELMKRFDLKDYINRFIEITEQSKKWSKWMLLDTLADANSRSLISGHYVFSSSEGSRLISELSIVLQARGIDLNEHLRLAVDESIRRYLYNFGIVASR